MKKKINKKSIKNQSYDLKIIIVGDSDKWKDIICE